MRTGGRAAESGNFQTAAPPSWHQRGGRFIIGRGAARPLATIVASDLTRAFGEVRAVDSMSFEVDDAEMFGFLGPNGAGKSTTMMMLTTLLKPTSGSATVAGHDVARKASSVRRHIGYVQQETTVDEYLTGRENLQLQARLSHIGGSAGSRIDEMLSVVELEERQHEAVISYSGGMRKRLDIAAGLLHRPDVLFLDEPTVGLDIQTRRKIWDYVRKIHDEYDTCVFLSTHYMEEADRLCDRVAIVDGGRVQVLDSPGSLKAALGDDAIRADLDSDAGPLLGAMRALPGVIGASARAEAVTIHTSDGASTVPHVFEACAAAGVQVKSVSMSGPTLDDVFVRHTGRDLRDGGKFDRKKEHHKMRRLRP